MSAATLDQPDPTPPTIYRLKRLTERGYVATLDDVKHVPGAVWLRHPNDNFRQRELILYADGIVVCSSERDHPEQLIILPNAQSDFERFARQIPRPTFWYRIMAPGFAYLIVIAGFAAMVGAVVVIINSILSAFADNG